MVALLDKFFKRNHHSRSSKIKRARVGFKIGRTVYEVKLATDSPKVNLQNEICMILNYVASGKKPKHKLTEIFFDKPSGWTKLRNKYYVKSKKEFGELLRKAKRGDYIPQAHQIKRRGKREAEKNPRSKEKN